MASFGERSTRKSEEKSHCSFRSQVDTLTYERAVPFEPPPSWANLGKRVGRRLLHFRFLTDLRAKTHYRHSAGRSPSSEIAEGNPAV